MAFLCPSGAPNTIHLEGTATWTAGSDVETGTATLTGSAGGDSRVELQLSGGSRVEVHSRRGLMPQAAFQATGMPLADGAAHRRKLGDAFTPAAWFFPAMLLSAVGRDGVVAADLGTKMLDGAGYERLRLSRAIPHQSAAITAELAQLSQADLYLDPATHYPRRLRFERHLDGNIRKGVPIEIRFDDYRRIGGLDIASRVTRYYNGVPQLVIAITSAAVNPQVAASDFVLEGAQ